MIIYKMDDEKTKKKNEIANEGEIFRKKTSEERESGKKQTFWERNVEIDWGKDRESQ